jgi:NAD(P)-dependent dehydrogenase (short-subunit alcohol dehydrogenase family)
MQQLEGRTAVVTGAASGIGLALARRAASEGMNVVLADVDEAGLEAAAAAMDGAPAGGVEQVRCDVSDPDQVEALADRSFERFGGVALLCNNAGVGGGGRVADLHRKDWQWVLGVNLWGVIHGVTSFLPRMLESGSPGHVVNTASMAGFFAAPGMAPYAVSKFGVVALSESMRGELVGTEVGVSVLCPGWVSTRIHESERSRPADLSVERAQVDDEMRDAIRAVIQGGLDPAEVAGLVFDAVRAERFWVFTHPEMVRATQARQDEVLGSIGHLGPAEGQGSAK